MDTKETVLLAMILISQIVSYFALIHLAFAGHSCELKKKDSKACKGRNEVCAKCRDCDGCGNCDGCRDCAGCRDCDGCVNCDGRDSCEICETCEDCETCETCEVSSRGTKERECQDSPQLKGVYLDYINNFEVEA